MIEKTRKQIVSDLIFQSSMKGHPDKQALADLEAEFAELNQPPVTTFSFGERSVLEGAQPVVEEKPIYIPPSVPVYLFESQEEMAEFYAFAETFIGESKGIEVRKDPKGDLWGVVVNEATDTAAQEYSKKLVLGEWSKTWIDDKPVSNA